MQSRVQELKGGSKQGSRHTEATLQGKMDSKPFLIDALIDGISYTEALVDSGCLCYAAISQEYCQQLNLPRTAITPRQLEQVTGTSQEHIRWITHAKIDLAGHRQIVYFYVIPKLAYLVILGLPWMKQEDITFAAKKQ